MVLSSIRVVVRVFDVEGDGSVVSPCVASAIKIHGPCVKITPRGEIRWGWKVVHDDEVFQG